MSGDVRPARSTMPSQLAIRRYWADWLVETGRFDYAEVFELPGYCFACGFDINGAEGTKTGGLERAHIVARTDGGTDDPPNLHLLCHECHENSEGLNGDAYFEWFKRRTIVDAAFARILNSGGTLIAGLVVELAGAGV